MSIEDRADSICFILNTNILTIACADVVSQLYEAAIEDADEEEEEVSFDDWNAIMSLVFSRMVPRHEPHVPDLIMPLRSIEQLIADNTHIQRSSEWYDLRGGMLTASNAYKAFGSEAQRNSLIFEKCTEWRTKQERLTFASGCGGEVVVEEPTQSLSTLGARGWGIMYEPLIARIYCNKFKTCLVELGCVQHAVYAFLGASPDGINVDPTSPLYGRGVEFKSVTTREITGVPTLEYWIQMQMQMEVCDLEACDFAETKFVEYDTYEDFVRDSEFGNYTVSHDSCKMKGCMLRFHGGQVEYMPDTIYHHVAFTEWVKATLDASTVVGGMPEFHFWKLDVFSCVTVRRNRTWFEAALPHLQDLWDTIQIEKHGDFSHRAPNSRKEHDTACNNWNGVAP
jgi:hypothetical protein